MIYIGAESIISPLGDTVDANWSALVAGQTGISQYKQAGFGGKDLYLAKIVDTPLNGKFSGLILATLKDLQKKVDSSIFTSEKTLLIISSTKGAIDDDIHDQFSAIVQKSVTEFGLKNTPVVVSNACISGVSSLNMAGTYIRNGLYDHVVVVGCDIVSDFVVYGFQALYAISDTACRPFDAARTGISLGEGCAAVVISNSSDVFENEPLVLLDGTTSNDANHISGPSRTGEGLVRSVAKTLAKNKLSATDIDFICAHGTATIYNDEMESIAFGRLGMESIPINSLKGFYGHTLGAAGVIESVVSIQMLRNGMMLKSYGFEQTGTSVAINVLTENVSKPFHAILKTASGFGGGNASLILQKL